MKKINRRKFIKAASITGVSSFTVGYNIPSPFPNVEGDKIKANSDEFELGEVLYNGIQLPKVWPPRNMDPNSYEPMPIPYLDNRPNVIPIDIGRQLFVDDFLIEQTTLKRVFHKAKKYEGNPVLKPETPLETGGESWYSDQNYLPMACPKDGAVLWDSKDNIFKMWYEAGWLENIAYAKSADGINWQRPNLDVQPGTNRILPKLIPNSNTVYIDHFTNNPKERYKHFICQEMGKFYISKYTLPNSGYCMVSADGIHWDEPVATGSMGDRSTMFYNPFRKKWVYSLRSHTSHGRSRDYHEHSDFLEGAKWNDEDKVFWTNADYLDLPDSAIGDKAQLYNLSAVAYESIILSLHEIHLGPDNKECMYQGVPKITELKLSYSRDGFHWHRPDREAFIPATRKKGNWERGYVQSVGGICTIVGDKLWFYYSGLQGDERKPTKLGPNNKYSGADVQTSGTYANGSTGIATLRRDGFASMLAGTDAGSLITRLMTFNGKYLFVNVDCPKGHLKVELLDEDNSVISPFTIDNCKPISVDSTIHKISWKDSDNLSGVKGKRVRLRFELKNGHLYSFWVSPQESGASNGYVAAGGPGYKGAIDDSGMSAYQEAASFQSL